jgi:hypothetical protein
LLCDLHRRDSGNNNQSRLLRNRQPGPAPRLCNDSTRVTPASASVSLSASTDESDS